MALFGKKKDEYDREEILREAARLEAKGNRKKAIAEYQKVLRWEPENSVLQGKLAVLLAENKQLPEAWGAFSTAANGYIKEGFYDKAISVYTKAASFFPQKFEVWDNIATLQLKEGRKPDAVKACLDGWSHLRKLVFHQQATHLLRKACEIEPWHFEATFDLAQLLLRTGGREEARSLLQGLATRQRGRNLRRVRRVQFNLFPTPAAAWRWLRAAVRGT